MGRERIRARKYVYFCPAGLIFVFLSSCAIIFSLYGLLLFFREDEPGMKMSEVIPSMAKTAKGYGFGLTTPMGHFVGLDLIEARVDADRPVILEPGVAMILHPTLDDFKRRRIILWGETYFMTERGPVRLTQTEDTLHTV